MFTRKPRQQLEKFAINGAKRLCNTIAPKADFDLRSCDVADVLKPAVFETYDIETLAPGYGCVLRGRKVLARHHQILDARCWMSFSSLATRAGWCRDTSPATRIGENARPA